MDILEPSYCGLSIKNRVMCQIMGKEKCGEFLKTREEYYNKWRFEQFSNPNFLFDNLNLLLKEAGL